MNKRDHEKQLIDRLIKDKMSLEKENKALKRQVNDLESELNHLHKKGTRFLRKELDG